MTDQKKLSRRDAFKILGAAVGATVLANLPSKWSKPEIVTGVLPAHAQTSFGLACDSNASVAEPNASQYVSGVTINLPAPNIVMHWNVSLNNVTLDNGADPLTGTVITNGSGYAAFNTPAVTIVDPSLSASVTVNWSFDDPLEGLSDCDQVFAYTAVLPTVLTLDVIPQDPVLFPIASFYGNVTNEGSKVVTERGFVYSVAPNSTPTIADTKIVVGSGIGLFESLNYNTGAPGDKYGRAFATSAVGTAYGAIIPFTTGQCLVEGTLISMADGSTKKIEDIEYSDWVQVWNFDEGRFDEAKPLWIKKVDVSYQYNLVEFSDGSYIKTVQDHRIFNKELGAFTYPMSEDTPIGTTTFNAKGEEVTLVKKSIVNEQVNYYNVITDLHMNLFANGILTSCRYNNIYPIVDMKFVKDDRELVPQEEYGVEDKYYEGMRLAEQNLPIADTVAYVNRLETNKVETQQPETELVIT